MGVTVSRTADATHGRDTDLSVVLRRIGTELEGLRDLCARTEDALGTAGLPATVSGDGRGLQGLDLMTQHLAALSAICGGLADQVPDGVRVDPGLACIGIGLQDVNDRLAGRAEPQAASDGAVELF